MRTMTSAQRAILEGPHYGSWLNLEIEDESGRMVSYTSRVDSVSWGQSIDNPIMELQAALMLYTSDRREGDVSLSPLVDIRIDLWRRCRLYVACVDERRQPTFEEYVLVFNGRIDSIDFGSDPLTFVARGPSPQVTTRWVEAPSDYGDRDDPPLLDTVMRQILADWAPNTPLVVPRRPTFRVTQYNIDPQSVMDALQRLAAFIGWVITARYDDNEGANYLTLIDPDRLATTPQWNFETHDYYDVSRLNLNLHTIRNTLTVGYVDADGEEQSVSGSDETSIARFGRLWFEIIEGTDSPIDTQQEARNMLEAALADLSLPYAEQSITTKFFWPVEINDLLRFAPNGVHYNDPQRWAVMSYRHVLSTGEDTTEITVRGQPRGTYRTWRQREAELEFEEEPFGQLSVWGSESGTQMYFAATGNDVVKSIGAAATFGDIDQLTEPLLGVEGNTWLKGWANTATGELARAIEPGEELRLAVWFYTGPLRTGKRSPRVTARYEHLDS